MTVKQAVHNAIFVDLPEPRFEKMSVFDFVDLPRIDCQRNEEGRDLKVRKRIRDSEYGTIGLVQIMEMPSGKQYVLDGNTRSFVWKQAINGHGLTKINVPNHVIAVIWELDKLQEGRDYYYTIDNSGAAENGPDKITGWMNQHGLDPRKMHNPMFTKGTGLSGVLDAITKKYPTQAFDHEEGIKMFKDEFSLIDERFSSDKGAGWLNKLGKMKSAAVCALALHLRKYPQDADSLFTGLIGLMGNVVPSRELKNPADPNSWHDPAMKRIYDVFNCQCVGSDENIDTQLGGIYNSGNNNNFTTQVGFVLYCFDKHVNGKTIKNTISADKARGYFNAF